MVGDVVLPPPPVPPPDVTVTALVNATLPNDAVMVALPAPTPVTEKFALLFPVLTIALEATDATALADEESAIVVVLETALDIPTVYSCAFPGANATFDGDSVLKTGVVPPPPVAGVPPVAIKR